MKRLHDWHQRISQPDYQEIVDESDVFIPMRDGVKLAADVHRPGAQGAFPALLAYQPWGKDHDAFGLHFPQQRRPSQLWDGALESGDTRYLVSRGYVHVVLDARGTGASGGEFAGFMGAGGDGEGRDIHDVIEWIAEQPWCDGNVGMVGISYLAAAQIIGAAERPPHLKAIFPEGGHYDPYHFSHHGGILWMMPRAAMRGRGGDSGLAILNPRSATLAQLGEQRFQELIEERLADPDYRHHPNYHQLLRYPELDPIWLDFLLHPNNDEFWWGDETLEERLAKIEVPVHLGVQLGRGWQLDDTIDAYVGLHTVKQLAIRPGPPMQERPFHEFHDEMVRWFDHWLKGSDTGMLDGPPITVALQGTNEVLAFDEWPPPSTQCTTLYLRSGKRLLIEPEFLGPQDAPPDGYYQAPQRVTDDVGTVTYSTFPFEQATDIVGPAALHLWASIDTEDTNWIATLFDVAPDGAQTPITTGWLKASHRELDEERSTPSAPVHPHNRAVPVAPGEIVHYPIRIFSLACRINAGHALKLEIKSVEDQRSINPMLPPESGHLNSARATTHKIHRDHECPSHLILPILGS